MVSTSHFTQETRVGKCYADRVGGAIGDLDLLELIDGSHDKLQCRSVCHTRQTATYMGEGLLTQRSRPDRATRHPHLSSPPELRSVLLGIRSNLWHALPRHSRRRWTRTAWAPHRRVILCLRIHIIHIPGFRDPGDSRVIHPSGECGESGMCQTRRH